MTAGCSPEGSGRGRILMALPTVEPRLWSTPKVSGSRHGSVGNLTECGSRVIERDGRLTTQLDHDVAIHGGHATITANRQTPASWTT